MDVRAVSNQGVEDTLMSRTVGKESPGVEAKRHTVMLLCARLMHWRVMGTNHRLRRRKQRDEHGCMCPRSIPKTLETSLEPYRAVLTGGAGIFNPWNTSWPFAAARCTGVFSVLSSSFGEYPSCHTDSARRQFNGSGIDIMFTAVDPRLTSSRKPDLKRFSAALDILNMLALQRF